MKDIPGYEGIYACDEEGNIYSLPRIIRKKNGWDKIFSWNLKLKKLSPGNHRDGYLQVNLRKDLKVSYQLVHRLIAKTFLNVTSQEINHIDGNKKNNKLSNLEISNRSHNVKHAFRIGLRSHKGKSHPKFFMTEDRIKEVEDLLAKGISQQKIAAQLGICQATVSDIKLKIHSGQQ